MMGGWYPLLWLEFRDRIIKADEEVQRLKRKDPSSNSKKAAPPSTNKPKGDPKTDNSKFKLNE